MIPRLCGPHFDIVLDVVHVDLLAHNGLLVGERMCCRVLDGIFPIVNEGRFLQRETLCLEKEEPGKDDQENLDACTWSAGLMGIAEIDQTHPCRQSSIAKLKWISISSRL